MKPNDGFVVEDKFVEAINDKNISELSDNLKHFVTFAFPTMDKNEKLKCAKPDTLIKPDICIYQKNNFNFVSIKSGLCEQLHTESLFTFIDFLKSQKIDKETIETYLLYQYGDGTTDGTGKTRMSSVETKLKFNERIQKMNAVFNKNKHFIKAFADRVMFQGVNPEADRAEILYHGDIDYGVFIGRSQMLKHIDHRTWYYMDKCVHIGPFVVRPKARYSNVEIKNENSRHVINVSYPRLIYDMQYIAKQYNN